MADTDNDAGAGDKDLSGAFSMILGSLGAAIDGLEHAVGVAPNAAKAGKLAGAASTLIDFHETVTTLRDDYNQKQYSKMSADASQAALGIYSGAVFASYGAELGVLGGPVGILLGEITVRNYGDSAFN